MAGITFGSTQTRPFVSSWKTDNAGTSSSTQITIPAISSGTYNCTVDWGDGSTSAIATWNDAAWTHTYSSAGTYTVMIFGIFTGIIFNAGGDRLKLMTITQLGHTFRVGTNESTYFRGCTNLTMENADYLNLQGTTSLQTLFWDCTSLNSLGSIGKWNTSGVTNLGGTFIGCLNFNGDISGWDTSNVTSLQNTFNNAKEFAGNLGSWNTSKVTNTNATFFFTKINSSLNSWDMSQVTNMLAMFYNCALYNQSMSTWDTSKVTTMLNMFRGTTAFNQDVSNFDIRALTDATDMFLSSGFSTTNYDLLLDDTTGWPSQATIQNGVVFNAGNAQYNAGAPTDGRAILTGTYTWTITDGGAA